VAPPTPVCAILAAVCALRALRAALKKLRAEPGMHTPSGPTHGINSIKNNPHKSARAGAAGRRGAAAGTAAERGPRALRRGLLGQVRRRAGRLALKCSDVTLFAYLAGAFTNRCFHKSIGYQCKSGITSYGETFTDESTVDLLNLIYRPMPRKSVVGRSKLSTT
jgi:hypothetical protein